MDARIAAIAFAQHGLITRAQLLDLGLSSRAIGNRISKGRLRVIHPRIYAVGGSPSTWDQKLLAAFLAGGRRSAISHLAAGAFWKMDGVATDRPHLLVPHTQQIRLDAVVVHRSRTIEKDDIKRRPPINVTTPTRTLVDLAGVLFRDDLEYALDDVLRRRLATVKRLTERVGRIEGRVAGLGRLRRLLMDRTVGPISGSPPEARFKRKLERSNLPSPVAQYEIRDEAGRLVARVDFAWPDARLAVEIDGWAYHSGRRRWESDLARQNRLNLAGWDLLRFTSTQADHDPHVLKQIAEALRCPRLGKSAVTS